MKSYSNFFFESALSRADLSALIRDKEGAQKCEGSGERVSGQGKRTTSFTFYIDNTSTNEYNSYINGADIFRRYKYESNK